MLIQIFISFLYFKKIGEIIIVNVYIYIIGLDYNHTTLSTHTKRFDVDTTLNNLRVFFYRCDGKGRGCSYCVKDMVKRGGYSNLIKWNKMGRMLTNPLSEMFAEYRTYTPTMHTAVPTKSSCFLESLCANHVAEIRSA